MNFCYSAGLEKCPGDEFIQRWEENLVKNWVKILKKSAQTGRLRVWVSDFECGRSRQDQKNAKINMRKSGRFSNSDLTKCPVMKCPLTKCPQNWKTYASAPENISGTTRPSNERRFCNSEMLMSQRQTQDF